jgi:hypothetical protein
MNNQIASWQMISRIFAATMSMTQLPLQALRSESPSSDISLPWSEVTTDLGRPGLIIPNEVVVPTGQGSENVCRTCLAVLQRHQDRCDDEDLIDDVSHHYDHHRTVADLTAAMGAGCHFCSVFSDLHIHTVLELSRTTAMMAPLQVLRKATEVPTDMIPKRTRVR